MCSFFKNILLYQRKTDVRFCEFYSHKVSVLCSFQHAAPLNRFSERLTLQYQESMSITGAHGEAIPITGNALCATMEAPPLTTCTLIGETL